MKLLVSILGMAASIGAVGASFINPINPKTAAWLMVGGAIAGAAGSGIARVQMSREMGLAAMIVAVAGALASVTNVIPTKSAMMVSGIAAIIAGLGQSVFGWNSTSSQVVGSDVKTKFL